MESTECIAVAHVNGADEPAEKTAEAKKSRKILTIFGVQFVHLYLVGIGMAALGWIAENAAKLATTGIIDSRWHLLPFISPYALVPFAFHIVLRDANDLTIFGKHVFKRKTAATKILSNIVTIAVILTAVFFGELIVGTLWDKLFGVKLWNYSQLPCQVNQYAGLIPTLGYGFGAYLIFKFIHTPALRFVQRKVSHKLALIICCTLGVLIVLDTLSMGVRIVVCGEAPMYWSVKLF